MCCTVYVNFVIVLMYSLLVCSSCHRNIGCVWKTDFIPLDLACRVCKVSGEVKSFPYLLQRLAVAVQQGNVVSVLGTFSAKIALFLRTVMHIINLFYLL